MPAADYKGKTYDLDRIAFTREAVIEDGMVFPAGATVRDVIKQASGIGYGGHFAEASDDELALYLMIAHTPDEYRWMVATRDAYCELLEVFTRIYGYVPQVWIQ